MFLSFATSQSTVIEVVSSHRLFIFDKQSKIQFLIDSGADVSIIPASIYRKTKQPDTYKLFAANNTTINTYGIQIISVDLGLRRQFDWEFLVADVSKAIIGADFLSKFGLVIDLKNKKLIDSVTKLQTECIAKNTKQEKISTVNPHEIFTDLLNEFRDLTTPDTLS